MCRASTAWGEAVHDLVRPLEALQGEVFDAPNRRWKPYTPAMAAGLMDHIWTVEDFLTVFAPPINTSGGVYSDKSQTCHRFIVSSAVNSLKNAHRDSAPHSVIRFDYSTFDNDDRPVGF